MKNGPLHGVRIIEFTSAWAGPYATCLLGFLGAEVIKVEDIKTITEYGIMMTPGLVVDGEVKSVGKVLSSEEIKMIISGT